MAALTQTIAIMDRSGKVINSSKQLKNVFLEAKFAYRERKAEIKAERKAKEDYELNKALAAMTVNDDQSQSVRRGPSRRQSSGSTARPHTERHHSGSSVRSRQSGTSPRSPPHSPYSRIEEDDYYTARTAPTSPTDPSISNDLIRRRTDMDLALAQRPGLARSNTTGQIDLDLAYGEYHPGDIMPIRAPEQQEMNSLVTKVKLLLDEANCAHASVTAVISHLNQNPEAMAAVALTLAEISNLAGKMAPGALGALKAGAPTVFALLAAPEFLIAVGVGIGITVVMFGGYKIIKKIRAKKEGEKQESMDEMLEIGGDVDRIDHWRRGIADVETASVGTSVDGEFITPRAAVMKGDPRLSQLKIEGKKSRKHRSKSDRSERSERSEKSEKSHRSRRSSKTSSSVTVTPADEDGRILVKVKKPSPLRRMFN